MSETPEQRRPDAVDLPELFELIGEGKSLRAACRELGLHAPSTHTFIHEDDGRREQYARAKVQRGEHYQEEGLTIGKAAALGLQVNGKKVDPAGARVYLDAIKWTVGRMDPKGEPVKRIDLTSRTRQMTDAEIAAEIAALEGSDEGEA
jgi:hypothetical protein